MPNNLKQFFEEIWEERPQYSEISGLSLVSKSNSQWHWQFSHTLSKGAFPKFKFNKENILLMTPQEHADYTNGMYLSKWTDEQIEFVKSHQERLKQEYFKNRFQF